MLAQEPFALQGQAIAPCVCPSKTEATSFTGKEEESSSARSYYLNVQKALLQVAANDTGLDCQGVHRVCCVHNALRMSTRSLRGRVFVLLQ